MCRLIKSTFESENAFQVEILDFDNMQRQNIFDREACLQFE